MAFRPKKTDEIASKYSELKKILRRSRRRYLDIIAERPSKPSDDLLSYHINKLADLQEQLESLKERCREARDEAEKVHDASKAYREHRAAEQAAEDEILAAWEELKELGFDELGLD